MFLRLRGFPSNVVSFGSGHTTLVGISGAFGTWEIWQQPFELLSERYRVVAYDHLGAGQTHVPAEVVTFAEQVAALEELVDALHLDRFVLAGDSTMCTVAVEVAARHPDRVAALALVAGGVVHEEGETTRRFVAGLRTRFEETVERFVDFCIPEEDSDHLREWLKSIIRRTGGERAALLVESFYGLDLSDRLPRLAMPTVVIQGEFDALPESGVESGRRMAEAIPRCDFVVVEGAGHVPTLTRPHDVARAIETAVAATLDR